MRPTSILALTLVLAAPVQAQGHEDVTETLDDGSTVERRVRVGADGSRVNDGPYRRVNEAGKVLAQGEYTAGLRTGRWRFRFEDGDPWINGDYRTGRRHGTWTFYRPGKQKRAEGDYDSGAKDGPWVLWNEDGSVDEEESGTYERVGALHPDGSIRFVGSLLDGRPNGPWTFYWPNGLVQIEATYRAGRRVGAWQFYHFDGTPDPLMVTRDHGDPGRFQSAELELIPGGDEVRTEDPVEPGPAIALADLPELELPSWVSDSTRRRTEEALVLFLSPDNEEAEAAARGLSTGGLAVLPFVLNALRELDLTDEEESRTAARIEMELCTELCNGRSFGWREGTDPEAVAANHLTVLRWYSFYSLTWDQPAFWDVDMTLGERRPVTGPSPTLLRPPVNLGAAVGRSAGVAFPHRFDRRRRLAKVGGDGTETALEEALAWLVAHQADDGSWDADGFSDSCGEVGSGTCDGAGEDVNDVGVTGLALLALVGDGNTPVVGPHRSAVTRGVVWLIDQQDPKTGLIMTTVPRRNESGRIVGRESSPFFVYGHAIATQVLCEVSMYCDSPAVRSAAERAVEYVVGARNKQSGWRYDSPPTGASDTSVTGWMALALTAAERAGIDFPRSSYDGALAWFDEVTDPATGRVGYVSLGSPSARVVGVNDHFPTETTEAMTAIALHCQLLLGRDPLEYEMLEQHADVLLRTPPEWDPEAFGCDMYYWLHGTYAMRGMGGRYWSAWNKALKRALFTSQRRDGDHMGSWDPVGPWGHAGGRVYSTAAMALCLEAYFRLADDLGG